MKRSSIVVGVIAAIGLSSSAFAQQLEWVNGQGDATGRWQSTQYRVEHWRLVQIDADQASTARIRPPALSYSQLAAESNGDVASQQAEPHYQLEHRKLVLQNPAPSTPREGVTMTTVERLYRDFSTS